MSVTRMSISLPPETAETVKAAADREGVTVSEWMAAAVEEHAERKRILAEGREAVAEFEAEFGPIPEKYRAEARAALARYGMLPGPERAAS